ncbi:MAG: class I SAM-dependent methyltransferase [Ktedonobacteraceae bacterium]|nr:class I SAM-dependent methyltransferase [Ktedonobacteraceae bacterium]
MASPRDARGEQPSTYFVQDRLSKEEIARVTIQDQTITVGMGGVLPEQEDPTTFKQVLDVGCGTGGWLIEAAKTYPTMTQLVGVDVSERMVEYARTQAIEQGVSERVQFFTMDVLSKFNFPDDTFDLVNQRLGLSYLRTWDWPQMIYEYRRVARSGGIVRVTEADMVESNSTALIQREQMLLHAFYQANHFFIKDKNGVTRELVALLERAGLENVRTQVHNLEYHSGTIAGANFAENMQHGFRTLLPFMRKWGQVPDNHEAIYRQMVGEMQQPGFEATWRMMTVWGQKE